VTDHGSMFDLLYLGQLLACVVSTFVVVLLLSADTVTGVLLETFSPLLNGRFKQIPFLSRIPLWFQM